MSLNSRECVPCKAGQQKKGRRNTGSYKTCNRMRFALLFTVYGSRNIIKLLKTYYLVPILRLWLSKNQKIVARRSPVTLPKMISSWL